jgi:hypothetical protein
VRERRSVHEFSDKEKKKTKKTLDTAGVVRDGRLCRQLLPGHVTSELPVNRPQT